MTCKPVLHVKQGRSGVLEAVLSRTTNWNSGYWAIDHLNQDGWTGNRSGTVVKQKTSKLEVSGVYSYFLEIEKDSFAQSCRGKILVYSRLKFDSE